VRADKIAAALGELGQERAVRREVHAGRVADEPTEIHGKNRKRQDWIRRRLRVG
jgi:hypothetical protein